MFPGLIDNIQHKNFLCTILQLRKLRYVILISVINHHFLILMIICIFRLIDSSRDQTRTIESAGYYFEGGSGSVNTESSPSFILRKSLFKDGSSVTTESRNFIGLLFSDLQTLQSGVRIKLDLHSKSIFHSILQGDSLKKV